MKEIRDILLAYDKAVASGTKTALATVVKIEGSSYRQPGARMLVTEDGLLTGAISGGCLEGDALRKALLCISLRQNKLITYDTSTDEDMALGVQLGCNGIIHILFEYVDEAQAVNPVAILRDAVSERSESVIGTLFSEKKQDTQPGTRFLMRSDEEQGFPESLRTHALSVLSDKQSAVVHYEDTKLALLSYHPKPVHVVINGAGNDVIPVVKAANLIGWYVTVADGRATHATINRFPEAGCVRMGNPKSIIENTVIDSQTYVVLMAHNYQYEFELLKLLLRQDDIPYIGILGPKTKFHKLLGDLSDAGINISESQMERLFGPVGLDIGAETAEEIAISIIAEIKSVISRRNGTSLKFRKDSIHSAMP